MEATECPKKTQPTKTSGKPTINAPRWFDSPIVRLIGWVFEVRQIALKEEGIDLKGHARRLKGKVPCLGKPDNYADGSCCVMQWMLPPPKTTCSDWTPTHL